MGNNDKHTQIIRIWDYLKSHPEGLTTLEAAYKLHITKLNTRVSEMLVLGYKISKTWETCKNAYGGTERYIRYKAVA